MKNSTAFILLLLSVALFYTVISPRYEKVKDLSNQSSQYKEILGNVSALSEKRDDLLVEYNNMPPAEVARLEKILPGNVDTVNLALNFDSIASRYGISIKSIRTVDSPADAGTGIAKSSPKPYQKITVAFSFISTYDNFRKFMNDVERSLRVIDVKSLAFQTTESGLYEYEVSVETYWIN